MRLKDEKRGILWVERVHNRRSWGILARNFSWKRGFGTKAKKIADIMLAELVPLPTSGNAACSMVQLSDSNRAWNWGIELVKACFHMTGDVGPTPILERGDGDFQFEFDGILGLKVTPVVAADDF